MREPPGQSPAAGHAVDEWLRRQRAEMVRRQLEARGIRDPRVLAALRAVPRHAFVPEAERARAYDDAPVSIGAGQTVSQPYIVALMCELAAIRAGDRVLEIGTGSGYQTAILASLTPPAQVYSLELVAELSGRAAATLVALGYTGPHLRVGDGYHGWPEAAPFDAILVTAAAEQIPAPLLEQLAPTGCLVIPVGPIGITQTLRVITRDPSGALDSRDMLPVSFVPFVRGSTPSQP